MGSSPVPVLLWCCFFVLVVVWAQQTEIQNIEDALPSDCREETYPCTRMYSVHRPIKRCIHSLCLYSLPRVYVINKEICVRTVCQQDELLMAELCREKSGWPKRQKRSNRRGCRRDNQKTWASRA
ncbi:microfibril associated protein 5 isoform X2 [Myxocyprinus asiaticus]|uniref:microfibril associated protein 5 isoform X2 n=1 Tax=Myxocyprinus asiaticus TaxID=70543 RepID=UPI002221D2D0|nr:microfibril associated protein 5 isoform X2 [Myxocyprinus asiaticus]XP_051575929.1 microfibril associated protein 5 isoform X2 [Myxocyprinus asiaticus]